MNKQILNWMIQNDLDQKVIFAMVEYFYDNPKAKNDLLKYANSNEDFKSTSAKFESSIV